VLPEADEDEDDPALDKDMAEVLKQNRKRPIQSKLNNQSPKKGNTQPT
jgi:hypothetical protein